MQFFLMRHGEASYQAKSDKERILTTLGKQQASLMAQWLTHQVENVDLVLLSPYIRVQQTWQQVRQFFNKTTRIHELEQLIPSADPQISASVITAYAEQFNAKNVLVIAHMPLLGYLVSELVRGIEPPLFATAAIHKVDLTDGIATSVWQQSPDHL
ncbi:MAG: phosphohistidine phosphatase SixA [Parashewanella sp.]